MAQCDTAALFQASAAFTGLSPYQLQLVNTALLCKILQANNPVATCNVQSLISASACFACVPAGQLALINTQLLCEILHAGSGGASASLTCGSGAPVAAPPAGVTCALYYDSDATSPTAGSFWFWDNTGVAWVRFSI